MNKKMATAMAGNIALAMIMTTGCQTFMSNRTAMDSEKQDPYASAPVVNIEDEDSSTPAQVTPTKLGDNTTAIPEEKKANAVVAEETKKADNAEKPATEETAEGKQEPSYQKYIIPADYKNPTEGLKPVDKRPDRTVAQEEEEVKEEEAPAVVDEDGYFTYVVKSGDCLSVIANSNGVKTKELAEINKIKVDAPVYVGQKLKVPAGREPFTSKKVDAANAVVDGSVYVVKSGDCLSIIAQNHGVKTADFIAENNLKNADSIYVGQKLKIPGKAKTPAVKEETKKSEPVVVEKEPATKTTEKPVAPEAPAKDDPFSLDQPVADPFAPAATEEPKAPAAPVETEEEVEEAIVIPPAPVEAEEEAEEADPFDIDSVIENFNNTVEQKATETVEKFENLKVAEGDTLELIAANYSTTAEELRKLNGFDSSKKLKAGEIIKIPAQTTK